MLPDIFLRLLSKKPSALASRLDAIIELSKVTATIMCHMSQDTSGSPLKPRPTIDKSQQYSETYTYFVVFKT